MTCKNNCRSKRKTNLPSARPPSQLKTSAVAHCAKSEVIPPISIGSDELCVLRLTNENIRINCLAIGVESVYTEYSKIGHCTRRETPGRGLIRLAGVVPSNSARRKPASSSYTYAAFPFAHGAVISHWFTRPHRNGLPRNGDKTNEHHCNGSRDRRNSDDRSREYPEF